MRLLLVLALAGCVALDHHGYVPRGASHETLVLHLPAESPAGRAMISSLGVLELAPHAGASTTVLHVRLVLANRRDTVWTFDTNRPRLVLGDRAPRAPLFVTAQDPRKLPDARIRRGEHDVFDFYFAFDPATDLDAAAFDFVWELETAARRIKTSTTFSRQPVGLIPARIDN